MDLEYEWFKTKIHAIAGIDLSGYRPEQMKRLVRKIMDSYGVRSYLALIRKLETEPSLVQEFKAQVTINVTCLFRDAPRWWDLAGFLDQLVRDRAGAADGPPEIRAWSAGCSIGAEPYSIAVLFEEIHRKPRAPDFSYRIFCSDLDRDMIARGMDGVYTEKEMRETPRDYVRRYFSEVERPARLWAKKSTAEKFYKVSPEIRANLRFRNQNIMDVGYDSSFELIACRNVMIYFNDDVKKNLFHTFSQALVTGGILFIGATEVIFSPDQFSFKSERSGIYRKT